MQSVNAHLKPTVSNSKMATRPCPSLQQPVNMWCRNDSQVWVVLAIYFYHGVEWNGYFVVYQFSANKWAQNIPAACPTSTPRDFGYQALHNLSLHFVLGGPRSVIVEPFMHLTTSIYRYLSIVCANHECCSGGGGEGEWLVNLSHEVRWEFSYFSVDHHIPFIGLSKQFMQASL